MSSRFAMLSSGKTCSIPLAGRSSPNRYVALAAALVLAIAMGASSAHSSINYYSWVAFFPGDGISLVPLPNSLLFEHRLGQPIEWDELKGTTFPPVVLCPEAGSSLRLRYFWRMTTPTGWSQRGPATIERSGVQFPPIQVPARAREHGIYAMLVDTTYRVVTDSRSVLISERCGSELIAANTIGIVHPGPVAFVAFPANADRGSILIRDVRSTEEEDRERLDALREAGVRVSESGDHELWRGAFTFLANGPRSMASDDLEEEEDYGKAVLYLAVVGILMGGYVGNNAYFKRLGFSPRNLPAIDVLQSYLSQLARFFVSFRAFRNVALALVSTLLALVWHWAWSSLVETARPGVTRTVYLLGVDARFGLPATVLVFLLGWGILYRKWFRRFADAKDNWLFWAYPVIVILSVVAFVGEDSSALFWLIGSFSVIVWLYWLGLQEGALVLSNPADRRVCVQTSNNQVLPAIMVFNTSKHLFVLLEPGRRPLTLSAANVSAILRPPIPSAGIQT